MKKGISVFIMCLGALIIVNLFARTLVRDTNAMQETSSDSYESEDVSSESIVKRGVDYSKFEVQFVREGAILTDPEGYIIFGPCKYIFETDLRLFNPIFRFVGEEGLIGYADADSGQVVVPECYIEGSSMEDGSACVRDENGYYYIDTEGNRFTSDYYVEAFPFAESQGEYARVKLQDGSWCLINRQGEELIRADEINPLNYIYTIGSGIRDNKAFLFSYFDLDWNNEPYIIKEFDDYCEISNVYDGSFAIVTDQNDNKGVVDWTGETIINAEYEDIDYYYVTETEFNDEHQYVFICRKYDGYDIFLWPQDVDETFL